MCLGTSNGNFLCKGWGWETHGVEVTEVRRDLDILTDHRMTMSQRCDTVKAILGCIRRNTLGKRQGCTCTPK